MSLLINEGKFILSSLVFLYLRKIYERNEKVFIAGEVSVPSQTFDL